MRNRLELPWEVYTTTKLSNCSHLLPHSSKTVACDVLEDDGSPAFTPNFLSQFSPLYAASLSISPVKQADEDDNWRNGDPLYTYRIARCAHNLTCVPDRRDQFRFVQIFCAAVLATVSGGDDGRRPFAFGFTDTVASERLLEVPAAYGPTSSSSSSRGCPSGRGDWSVASGEKGLLACQRLFQIS